jgi:hypothetical protein
VVATERLRRVLQILARWGRGLLGGVVAGGSLSPAPAATLPEDKAEAMFHSYVGGGVQGGGCGCN